MQSFYVNIYNPNWWMNKRPLSEQLKHETREASIQAAELWTKFFYPAKPAYRIHVKMKPQVDPKFNNLDCRHDGFMDKYRC